MPSAKVTGAHDGLITVQEFADRYRVDAAVVRGWVKDGRVRGALVGPRMIRLDPSFALTPIIPKLAGVGIKIEPGDPLKDKREQLVGYLVALAGMDIDLARSVAEGMEPADVVTEHATYAAMEQPF